MGDNTERAVFYLAATIAREAILNWEKVLLAALIIERYGSTGAKFVGLVGLELVKAQVQLTINIARHFGSTIGIEIYNQSRIPRLIGTARLVAPVALQATAVGVGAYALAKSPEVTYDFFADTSNYGTDPQGNLYVHPLILQGAVTN